MKYMQYTALDGERWDTIAYKAYGNPAMVKPIIEANPNVKIEERIPVGTVLQIPIISEDSSTLATQKLPPWFY